jgi:hypothetical protein
MRLGHAREPVTGLALLDVDPGRADFVRVGHAKSVVIVARLVGSARPGFVDHEPPWRVGMLEHGLALLPLHDPHREQVGEDRDGVIQGTAFVVAVREPGGFQHANSVL